MSKAGTAVYHSGIIQQAILSYGANTAKNILATWALCFGKGVAQVWHEFGCQIFTQAMEEGVVKSAGIFQTFSKRSHNFSTMTPIH